MAGCVIVVPMNTQPFDPARRVETSRDLSHTLTVFNAVDVPETVAAEIMRILMPYSADIYTRPCDAAGYTHE